MKATTLHTSLISYARDFCELQKWQVLNCRANDTQFNIFFQQFIVVIPHKCWMFNVSRRESIERGSIMFLQNKTRTFWTRSICQMVATFFWSWILKDFIQFQKEERKFVVVWQHPPQNVKLGGYTSSSCSGRQRNVLESVMHVQSCCVDH